MGSSLAMRLVGNLTGTADLKELCYAFVVGAMDPARLLADLYGENCTGNSRKKLIQIRSVHCLRNSVDTDDYVF